MGIRPGLKDKGHQGIWRGAEGVKDRVSRITDEDPGTRDHRNDEGWIYWIRSGLFGVQDAEAPGEGQAS